MLVEHLRLLKLRGTFLLARALLCALPAASINNLYFLFPHAPAWVCGN